MFFARYPLLFALLLASAHASGVAHAQPPPTAPYRVDVFTSEAGLPGHQVYDLEQTADGYLWVATNGGLARFDGYRFEVQHAAEAPRAGARGVTSLHLGAGGDLFVAMDDGRVLAYPRGRPGARVAAVGAQPFTDLAQDRTGRLWGAINQELHVARQGRFERVAATLTNAGGGTQLYADGAGALWTVRFEGGRTRPTSTQACRAPVGRTDMELARLEGDAFVRIAPSLFNRLVPFPSRREVLVARAEGDAIAFATPEGIERGRFFPPATACPLLMSQDGALWVREGAALARYAPGASAPTARVALDVQLGPNFIAPLFEDREGTLWIGSATRGLARVRRDPFVVYATASNVNDAPVLTLARGEGESVLIRDRAYSVHRVRSGRLSPVLSLAAGVYEDDQGRLLYQADSLIYRRVGGVTQPLFALRHPGGSTSCQFYADPHEPGVVWTHDFHAVYRLDAPMGPDPTLTVITDGLSDVRQLHRDRQGHLWIGTSSGLYRVAGGAVTRFSTADGLRDDRVRAIHEDPGGALWFGTYSGGLVRFDGARFEAVTVADGLAENVVSSILEDDAGYFWMAGNRGVYRTARADLEAFLDGRLDRVTSVLYGRESGLVNPETAGTPALEGLDGRLWFPTFYGAAVVDPPTARALDRAPPLVHVQALGVGDTTLVRTGRPMVLAADQRRFSLTYAGLTFRHPEAVRYRYRLDGLDADWVDAGTERIATYTNVPPGDYTFRVQAQGFGGVWSEADGTLALSVAPFFYETWWFALLCGLALVGLVGGGFRLRLRQAAAREAALNAFVAKRTEALRARTEDLEQEKETVAAQATALRSLDEAKSRVFANISHEFRTPLTLILGPLEDVRDGSRGPIPAPASRSVEGALRNGRRLLRLVNQLLDVSRLEAGRLTLEARPLDVGAFIERIAQAFAPIAERKHITFRVEAPEHPVTGYLDPEQFEKVLANLLGNAFKFTPEGGAITVTLATETSDSGPGHFVLGVRDDGPGIAPEHLPHLFERFYQVDASSTRQQPGTGIGLALVKNLVELHGGTVGVESTLGEGASFTIQIPLGRAHLRDEDVVEAEVHGWKAGDEVAPILVDEIRPAAASAVAEASSTDDAHAITVLVADDNPDIRAYVRRHLAPRYRVLEAGDGQQALSAARAHLPDLIVSDVMMPELDGFGLLRALRADPEVDFIPVVLLTARASAESKLEGLEGGADDYLTKPFNVRELEVRVENLIASRQRLKRRYAGSAGANDPHGANGQNGAGAAPAPAQDEDPFETEVRAVIAARLSEDDFSVEALAAAVGLGRTTLYGRIGAAFGCTPMEMIWQMRLERAAALLREGQGTVGEVAYGVGFKNVAHFCTRFREAYAATPAAYASEQAARGA